MRNLLQLERMVHIPGVRLLLAGREKQHKLALVFGVKGKLLADILAER